MSSLSHWPATERPRERLLTHGASTLSDAELLALIVGASSRGGGNVVETCRELLGRFHGLPGLGRSQPGELMRVRGIGAARACALAASLELARRSDGLDSLRGDPISCAEDVARRLRPRVRGLQQETFWVLALDAKHRLLAVRQVAQGTATSVEVHPREVFHLAVREAALAVIAVHNHPSGDPRPSREDERLTARLREAGEILGIPLMDHVIIAGRAFVSLAALGLLGPPLAGSAAGRVSEGGWSRIPGEMTRRPRYPLQLAVHVALAGEPEQPAQLCDLGEWGLGLRTGWPIEDQRLVRVRLPLPRGPTIHLLGKVVWTRDEALGQRRCGLRIQALPVGDLLALREHLERARCELGDGLDESHHSPLVDPGAPG